MLTLRKAYLQTANCTNWIHNFTHNITITGYSGGWVDGWPAHSIVSTVYKFSSVKFSDCLDFPHCAPILAVSAKTSKIAHICLEQSASKPSPCICLSEDTFYCSEHMWGQDILRHSNGHIIVTLISNISQTQLAHALLSADQAAHHAAVKRLKRW